MLEEAFLWRRGVAGIPVIRKPEQVVLPTRTENSLGKTKQVQDGNANGAE